MYRIYELTDEAKKQGINWDEAIYNGEIQTVEEFETKEEALQVYEGNIVTGKQIGRAHV